MPQEGQARDGVVRRALYCDESGISGDHDYYGFGALIMAYQRRGQFAADIEMLRREHKAGKDEIKWSKTNRFTSPFYTALIDYFFEQPFLLFHCMVVERAWVKAKLYHGGSFDTAREKHFTHLLSDKVTRIKKVHRGRETEIRVYVDKIPSSYPKVGEAIGIIANRIVHAKLTPLKGFADKVSSIDFLAECESHDYVGIQIADLLLGAVVDTWNRRSTTSHKANLQTHIAKHLGWEDLRSDTMPEERKFNIWRLTDQFHPGQVRPVETRKVKLEKPLPPIPSRRRW
jgi:hypothetical protein